MAGTNIDVSSLRRVQLDHTPQGPQFHSNDIEPLREGEWVKYDPKDTRWYGQGYCEERAVIGRVGRILSVGRPYEALGEGETYEEQCKNRRMVRHSYGAVAYAASYVCPRLVVVEGGPSDWLPGLEELKGTEGMQNE